MLAVDAGCMKAKAFVHKTQESCYAQMNNIEAEEKSSLVTPICFYKEML